jgi:hypothetical protein
MRELVAANRDLTSRIEHLELGHDWAASVIKMLVEDIERLGMKALPEQKKRRIGFPTGDETN